MEEKHYTSMKRNILISMILVPAIPFVCASLIGYYFFMTSLESETISTMTRIVEDHRQMIESFLHERRTDLQFIADTYDLDTITQGDTLAYVFAHLQDKSSAFTDVGVFDQSGLHIAYHGPYKLAGKVYKDAEWFKMVLVRGYYLSDVFLGYRNIPHFVIAVLKKEGDRMWVIRSTIDTSLFSDVVEKIRIGGTGEAYILNREGKFQTQRRSGGQLMEPEPDLAAALSPHGGVNTFVKEDDRGDVYLYATTWLNNWNWILVARQDKAEAYQALRKAAYLVLITALLGGLAIVSIAFYMTNRVINRIRRGDREKSELGQQLVRAGRLAEIGEMSAGFAHEINNPLQIIRAEQTLAQSILDDLRDMGKLENSEDTDQIRDSLHQIQVQVDRCGEITQALLKFARQRESKVRSVDLNTFLPEISGLVRRKAKVEGITLELDIPSGISFVQADPSQLQQVLINLLNNAIDAIIEKSGSAGGSVMVRAKQNSDGNIDISVTDSGCGISSDNLNKIFTPFFTTKPVGKGTGLGLSICYGIVTKMGGEMEVQSEKGKGTTFTIRLPSA